MPDITKKTNRKKLPDSKKPVFASLQTNLEIGYSTPPVGINLFIASFRFKKPIVRLYLAAIPFLILLLISLIFITYFEDLSLFLVRIVAGP